MQSVYVVNPTAAKHIRLRMRISHVQAKVLQWYLEAMGYVTFEEALAAGDATDIGFYQKKTTRGGILWSKKVAHQ